MDPLAAKTLVVDQAEMAGGMARGSRYWWIAVVAASLGAWALLLATITTLIRFVARL